MDFSNKRKSVSEIPGSRRVAKKCYKQWYMNFNLARLLDKGHKIMVGRSGGEKRHANPTFCSVKKRKREGYVGEDYKRNGYLTLGDKRMYKESFGEAGENLCVLGFGFGGFFVCFF